MSVVDQVANVQLEPEQKEAIQRLEKARSILKDSEASEDVKLRARVSELTELAVLNKFGKIVEICDKLNTSPPALISVYAYSLYRLGEVSKLRSIVEESSPVGAQLSLAQAEYKTGNLVKSREILQRVAQVANEEEEADVAVNLSAIDALLGTQLDLSQLSEFDANFNSACYELTRGNPETALKLLSVALEHAEEEDDRQAAVLQASYAHQLRGHDNPDELTEARNLLEQVVRAPESKSLALVAQNNLAALQYDGSIISAHHALIAFDEFLKHSDQLNDGQKCVLNRNLLKLLYRVGASSGLKRAQSHTKRWPNDFEPQVVALNYGKMPKQIRKLASEGSFAAQIWGAAKNKQTSLPQSKDNTSLQEGSALQAGNIGQLLDACSLALKGDELTLTYFESLGPQFARAGQLLLNPTGFESKEVDDLITDIDAEELERKGLNSADITTNIKSTKLGGQKSLKRKRGGKPKLPANYDPTVQPDPERWLPKADRTDYKSKKGKKSQATQGFATDNTETQSAPAAVSSQVVGAKSSKKKNKKGRK